MKSAIPYDSRWPKTPGLAAELKRQEKLFPSEDTPRRKTKRDVKNDTLRTFHAVVADYRENYPEAQYPFRVQWALHAVWWFVENVTQDDPDRAVIFFELREMVREALGR